MGTVANDITPNQIEVWENISYSNSGNKKYFVVTLRYNSLNLKLKRIIRDETIENPTRFKDVKIIGEKKVGNSNYMNEIRSFISYILENHQIKKNDQVEEEFSNIPKTIRDSFFVTKKTRFSNSGSTKFETILISNGVQSIVLSQNETPISKVSAWDRNYAVASAYQPSEVRLPLENHKEQAISLYKKITREAELVGFAKEYIFPDGKTLWDHVSEEINFFHTYDGGIKENKSGYIKTVTHKTGFFKIFFSKEIYKAKSNFSIIELVKKGFADGSFKVFERNQILKLYKSSPRMNSVPVPIWFQKITFWN